MLLLIKQYRRTCVCTAWSIIIIRTIPQPVPTQAWLRPVTTRVRKPEAANTVRAPYDEQHAARNMLLLIKHYRRTCVCTTWSIITGTIPKPVPTQTWLRPVTTCVRKPEAANTVRAPYDEQHAGRNMLLLIKQYRRTCVCTTWSIITGTIPKPVPTQTWLRPVTTRVRKPEATNTVRAPDDERHAARNMLSLQWTVE